MKKFLLYLSLSICMIGMVQNASAQCDGSRYYSQVFSTYDMNTVSYCIDSSKMDIYTPHGDAVTSGRRAVMFIHGGSFINGSRTDPYIVYLCQQFAKRGYVAVSIDYYLIPIQDINAVGDSTTAYPLVVKSISDGKAAVRYLKKNGAALGIDTSWIAIGGESAGGILADHVAYLTSYVGTTPELDSALATIGGLDGNSGNAGYSTNVKAVVNLAGALLDLNMISSIDSTPCFSAQGDADGTVPYMCGQVLGGGSNVVMCGAGAMAPVLTAHGIRNQLLTFPGADHVPWDTNTVMGTQVDAEAALFLYQLDCPTFTAIHEVPGVHVSLYPNPSATQIHVQTDAEMESLDVIDRMGRIVNTISMSGTKGEIDLSALSSGIYVAKINLKDNRGSIVRTFVAE